MTLPLEEILIRHIARNGPVDVGWFMNFALTHPEHGYYGHRDPLGRGGDFVTAPEISQMFGEMLGLWVADWWMRIGAPDPFILLECGPGRGTLMADALRATRHVSGFHAAAKIHLLEISPALRVKQKAALLGFSPCWHEGLEMLPGGMPIIALANEFLDALPFRQVQKTPEGWQERVINHDAAHGFFFALRPCDFEISQRLSPDLAQAPVGSIFEYSPAREGCILNLARRVMSQGGAALFIDYGHEGGGTGDTFQAVHVHRFCDVLEKVGEADLTSHVDFGALRKVLLAQGVPVYGPLPQGAFLKNLGIEVRAQDLLRKNGPEKADSLQKDLHRLCASSEMGTLFKVIAVSRFYETGLIPAGF
ncbi:MAG: SAM-dependent methyltransferase [Alphaproteobacteria bacterium]|nr:SAM-dependent methyltransferase [Alphaproteobacteria bacterium]